MPVMDVSKEFHFEAAHSLPHLPEGHKCRNKHGHSYRVLVVCRGEVDERGFVIDYAEISQAMRPILLDLDHQDLDSILGQSTAEWLAYHIFVRLQEGGLQSLYSVGVSETAKTWVTCAGD